MNAKTVMLCDCGECAKCRPDLHKKENECVRCGCYNLTEFKKVEHKHIHCLDCYREVRNKKQRENRKEKKQKKEKKCTHKYECGCNKKYCEYCESCAWGFERLDCENMDCKSYYLCRNDNCNCDGLECGFCNPK